MCLFAKDLGNSECPKFSDAELLVPLDFPLSDPVEEMAKHGYSDGFFDVHPDFGFLPIKDPLPVLPERYAPLQKLLDAMPYHCRKNSETNQYEDVPGLLATPDAIVEAVKELPNFVEEVKKEEDKFVIAALYRNYVFLTSGYLLEPSNHHFVKTGEYGPARRVLPANIAQPLVVVSEKLNVYPWLDYHYAYSLGNWIVRDRSKPHTWDNLDMATCFSGRKDEHGFIMIHADINQHSPELISAANETLVNLDKKDVLGTGTGLRKVYDACLKLNERRKHMWEASGHARYNDFRVFIMGSYNNKPIFGDGVVYEGTDKEGETPKLHAYRGESGAQDDIIPFLDSFTGIMDFYALNDLTKYLLDLRTYRPKVVQRFLNDVRHKCARMHKKVEELVQEAIQKGEKTNAADALAYLACVMDQIHEFRHGHWMFVQRYIMANTKYEMASGGTPITTWLPNNIGFTLAALHHVIEATKKAVEGGATLSEEAAARFNRVAEKLPTKLSVLHKQQEVVKNPNYDPQALYDINGELKETTV